MSDSAAAAAAAKDISGGGDGGDLLLESPLPADARDVDPVAAGYGVAAAALLATVVVFYFVLLFSNSGALGVPVWLCALVIIVAAFILGVAQFVCATVRPVRQWMLKGLYATMIPLMGLAVVAAIVHASLQQWRVAATAAGVAAISAIALWASAIMLQYYTGFTVQIV